MGQFLRGLFNGQRPPSGPRSPSDSTPTGQDESAQQQQRPQPEGSDDTSPTYNSNPYAKQQPVNSGNSRKVPGFKSAPPKTASPRASLGATTIAKKNFKTIDTSSATYEATQGFDAVAIKQRAGLESLQPVDAISESKSTSSGTRRVYKVIRVAPSNFLTAKKHQSNLGSTKSTVGQQRSTTQAQPQPQAQAQAQPRPRPQQQSQQNNKQTGNK